MSSKILSSRLAGTTLIIETSDGETIYDSKFLVAALLVFVAQGSGRIEPEESAQMIELIEDYFHMQGAESLELITYAMSELAEHPSLETLLGDAANPDLLLEENIASMDVFCALTNDDEANILSSMLAKRMGAEKVIAIINRPSYVDLVESSSIDIAVSPQQITIGALLTHIRRGNMVRIHSLRRGAAEAIEAVAMGDKRSSRVVGRAIEDIDLPPGTTIPAVVRGEEVIIAHHDVVIESDDHVILFLVDRRKISAVEKLFAVGFGFFS